MSFLSSLFGKKIRAPKVKPLPEIDFDTDWAAEDELKRMAKRSGFLSTIKAGQKKPFLGAR